MIKNLILISSIAVLSQSCSDLPVKQTPSASVTSTPSGAIVYANDSKLGTTPLEYDLYDAFPAGWKNSSYQAQGVLLVKKTGCSDYTLNVNDYILSKPIHAKLKCTAPNKDIKPALTQHQQSIENRLEKVNALHKKGLISTDEYNATRERILNEL